MIICEVCGTETKPGTRGRAKKYCSPECRSGRKHEVVTHCLSCNVELIQNVGKTKKTCGGVCRDKLRAITQKELRQRTTSCPHCQKSFTAPSNQKYCSSECRLAAYKLTNPHKQNTEPKVIICGWCEGEVIVPPNFTSNRKYHDRCKVEAKRARYRIKTVKRQSRTVKPSRLSADEVVRTYGSKCSICSEEIDMSLARTSRLGLTVDHVIPLSKGGQDTIDNMRPAHWICNVRKGNKTDA